jgi:hypothetical protein
VKRLVLLAMLINPLLFAEPLGEPVVLTIEVENWVVYRGTVFDISKIATEPGPTTSDPHVFIDGINVGDIVSINGQPAKGLWSSSFYAMTYRSAPQPGQAIADFDLSGTNFCTWQIFAPDGTFLGMIRDSGAGQGHTILGGLAAFLGAIGSHDNGSVSIPPRQASVAEDPANRRLWGGGKLKLTYYVYPRFRPAVEVIDDHPAVYHADFTPVTHANPARPGETLTLAATGLGPVNPDLAPPGAVVFSGPPFQEISLPLKVLFNGVDVTVTNKIGWPGQKSIYRVDFQLPSDAVNGRGILQLVLTWIPGPVVTIPVRHY